jgi:hypothetical protein
MLYCPFRALHVQVTAPTPHTAGRLLAVSPDMAELLADVTLREPSLGSVRLSPDCDMARLVSLNISWDSDVRGKVIRKRGMFTVVVPSAGDRRVADICFTL